MTPEDLKKMNEQAAVYRKAFDLVKNQRDWKAPVHAYVNNDTLAERGLDINTVKEAIVFFTATEPMVKVWRFANEPYGYEVQAAGYRMGPAGP